MRRLTKQQYADVNVVYNQMGGLLEGDNQWMMMRCCYESSVSISVLIRRVVNLLNIRMVGRYQLDIGVE
jgi:hypothetical protein